MPGIRDYPPASSPLGTDAFVISREGIGTMYIDAQDFLGGGGAIYDLAWGDPDTPNADDNVIVWNAVRPVTFDFANSIYTAETPFTGCAAVVFSVFQNDNQLGTISFTSGETVGVANCVNATFTVEDQLIVTSPDDLREMAGFAFTLKGAPA